MHAGKISRYRRLRFHADRLPVFVEARLAAQESLTDKASSPLLTAHRAHMAINMITGRTVST